MTAIDLHHNADPPDWRVEGEAAGRRVVLGGSWRLFMADAERKRLQHELSNLDHPEQLTWDLTGITALDSAGAWLLWQVWDRQSPAALECAPVYQQRFDRLADAPPVPHSRNWPTIPDLLDRLGADLIGAAQHVVGLARLLVGIVFDIATWIVRPRLIPAREISAAVYQIGVSSVALLGLVGFMIGVVMSLQMGQTLSNYGANQRIIGLMGLAVLRGLGPVMTALLQVGRSGSAITAGIAGMRLTEELDALQTFGGSPRMRLVTSRVVAMVITLPMLVVWTDAAAVAGSAAVAQFELDIPLQFFLARLPQSVDIFNFWLGLIKGAIFGLIIAVVSSYFGLIAQANTESLSAETTRSVVVGLSLILIIDGLSGAVLAKLGLL